MNLRHKGLRRWLTVAGVLLLAALGVVFFTLRQAAQNPQLLREAIPGGTHIAVGEVRHTAVRDGRKEWELEAASASYVEKTGQAVFEKVDVTFYPQNGDPIRITGRNGQANTETNDIEVRGAVVVHKADYTLETEQLNYDHQKRLITAVVPVLIEGPALQLRSDRIEIDLDKETSLLQGNVEGIFNDSKLFLP